MLYIVILNHQLSLVNIFVRKFHLLTFHEQLAAELRFSHQNFHGKLICLQII